MTSFSNNASSDYFTGTNIDNVESTIDILSSKDYISNTDFDNQMSNNSITYLDIDSLTDANSTLFSDDFSYYEVLSTLFDLLNSDEYNDSSYLTEEDIIHLVGTMDIDEYNDFIKGIEDYYQSQSEFLGEQVEKYDQVLKDLEYIYYEYLEYLTDGQRIISNGRKLIKEEIETSFNDINNPPYYEGSYYPEGVDSSLIISKEEYDRFLNEMTDEEQEKWLQKWFPSLIPNFETYLEDKKFYTDKLLNDLKEKGYEDIKISSIDEFLEFYKELSATKEYAVKCKREAENTKESAYYDYLYFLKDYQEFSSNFSFEEPTKQELEDFYNARGDFGMIANTYSYEAFKKIHPDCSQIHYLEIAKKNGIPIDPTLITGIDNMEQLNDLLSIAPYSPEFIKAYSYILKTNDQERIDNFFKNCEYEINNIKGQILAQNFLSKLGEEDGKEDTIEAVANELNVSVEGLKDGLNSFGDGIYYSLESFMVGIGAWEENRARSPEDYKKMYILEALLSNKAKEDNGLIYKDEDGNYQNSNPNSIIDFTKTYSGVLLNSNYEISQGIGNMLPSMAIGLACPMSAPLGSIAMGISAGGNAYHSAMVEGHSYLSSFAYGIMSGSSEAFTEWTLGGIFGLSDIDITSWVTYFQSMAREGGQEMLQGTLDELFFKSAILGEKIPTKPEEWLSFGLDTLKQGVYGAITAGIINVTSIPRILSQSNDENVIYYENGTAHNNRKESLRQWKSEVKNSQYTSMIDGITFASQTQEGLNQLLDYYTYVKSNASTSGKFFIQNLNDSGLWITDFSSDSGSGSYQYGDIVYIDSATLSKKKSSVFYHEAGHFYDVKLKKSSYNVDVKDLVSFILGDSYNGDINDSVKKFKQDYQNYRTELENNLKRNRSSIEKEIEKDLANKYYDYYNWSVEKRRKIIQNEYSRYCNKYINKNMDESSYGAISDILDAITGGELYKHGYSGHGSEYFKDSRAVAAEILANVSDLYNSGKRDLLYKYFSVGVCKNLIHFYEDIVGIYAIRRAYNTVDYYSNGDVGTVQFASDLLSYLSEHDSSIFGNMGDFGDFLLSLSDEQIKAYLVSLSVVEPYLDYAMSVMDSKYGKGTFLKAMDNYLETGNINTITRDSNIRDYVGLLSKDQIILYLAKNSH